MAEVRTSRPEVKPSIIRPPWIKTLVSVPALAQLPASLLMFHSSASITAVICYIHFGKLADLTSSVIRELFASTFVAQLMHFIVVDNFAHRLFNINDPRLALYHEA